MAQACTAVAFKRPPLLKAHFGLYTTRAHPRTTQPLANVRYRLEQMPPECFGAYQRVLQVYIRYKTTLLPWKTVRSSTLHGWPKWALVDSFDEATSGVEQREVGESGFYYDFGEVTRVKGRARVLVRDLSAHAVIAQRALALPMTFSARRQFR